MFHALPGDHVEWPAWNFHSVFVDLALLPVQFCVEGILTRPQLLEVQLCASVRIGNADAEALRDFPSVAYSAIERAADCLEAFRWEPAYLGHRAAQEFKDRHGTG